GDATPIGMEDRWHLGSDTKAMTATLAALAVQSGRLSWTSRIGSVLSDWTGLAPDYDQVTLEQLLMHRGGLPHDIPPPIWSALWKAKDPVEGRRECVRALLKQAPNHVGT